MPFHEFRCASCEHVFEELIRSTSQKPLACPKRGHAETSRLLSTFSVGASTGGSSSPSFGPCGKPIGGGCGGGACGIG